MARQVEAQGCKRSSCTLTMVDDNKVAITLFQFLKENGNLEELCGVVGNFTRTCKLIGSLSIHLEKKRALAVLIGPLLGLKVHWCR